MTRSTKNSLPATPLILVSNDDGINSPGIRELHRALCGLGEAVVVAPDREQSTCSHALSLHHPLRVSQLKPNWFAVNGTPADCVYLATSHLLSRTPDLVVSGINAGANLACDVIYSGTVAAAVEGVLVGIPSIAVSLTEGTDFAFSAKVAQSVSAMVLERGLPAGILLNVNVPPNPTSDVALVPTRLGRRNYHRCVDVRTDPRGNQYYWLGGPHIQTEPVDRSDSDAIDAGHVSVTPLHLDATHYEFLQKLGTWSLDRTLQKKPDSPSPTDLKET